MLLWVDGYCVHPALVARRLPQGIARLLEGASFSLLTAARRTHAHPFPLFHGLVNRVAPISQQALTVA